MSEPGNEQPEISDLLRERREKLERIRESGTDPFPHSFPEREEIGEVRRAHEGLPPGGETESVHRIAGRILARRGHGGAAFIDLRDASGQIQLHAREDLLGEDRFEALVGLDLGDIVGISGTAFASKRGELTLRVDSSELLAKSLRPPPDRYHGLEDTETRYRRRELDLIANEETRRLFAIRARVIAEVRRYFDEHATELGGRAFEEWRPDIRARLERDKHQQLVKTEIAQVRRGADVRIVAPFARSAP